MKFIYFFMRSACGSPLSEHRQRIARPPLLCTWAVLFGTPLDAYENKFSLHIL